MSDKGPISAKQREILDYLKKEILGSGFPPSVREICSAVSLKSTSSVHAHLEALEKNGYIKKDPAKPRTIIILDDDFEQERIRGLTGAAETGVEAPDHTEYESIPVIGNVAAGQPLLAVEQVETYFPVPVSKLPNKQTFILHVKGESMINAGILDGDYVLVEQDDTARNGDMIVALVDDSATVKNFYKENGYIRLQPQNDNMDPIIVTPDRQFQVLGKVIGVMRFFR
ncbi:MAG: transcriptional repressor LexA [Eubacterium sp.]|nr:transcriptional repressor LexA [Eubacterium sp.]